LKNVRLYKEELIGETSLLQGANSDPETVTYLKNQISKEQPFNCEIINYSKMGRILGKYSRASYIKKGEIVRFFAIEENVSNKKLLETKRRISGELSENK
jgi:hypothetical protein